MIEYILWSMCMLSACVASIQDIRYHTVPKWTHRMLFLAIPMVVMLSFGHYVIFYISSLVVLGFINHKGVMAGGDVKLISPIIAIMGAIGKHWIFVLFWILCVVVYYLMLRKKDLFTNENRWNRSLRLIPSILVPLILSFP